MKAPVLPVLPATGAAILHVSVGRVDQEADGQGNHGGIGRTLEMNHTAAAKPASNSTMQLARTSSGVRPVKGIRHNLAEPETDHSEVPVTIDYLEGFHRSA